MYIFSIRFYKHLTYDIPYHVYIAPPFNLNTYFLHQLKGPPQPTRLINYLDFKHLMNQVCRYLNNPRGGACLNPN